MTPLMSKIIPIEPGVLSDWNCETHYFYEILNRTGKDIYIKFVINSKDISNETKERCNEINEFVSMKQSRNNWIWWTAYKTSKVMISTNLNKEDIFKELDGLFTDIQAFENQLASRLKIVT